MSTKGKGSRTERELVHMFFDKGWGVLRVAGSGSTRLPAPDLLAGNGKGRFLSIECKSLKNTRKYFTDEDLNQLNTFAKAFGTEAWLALRFNNKPWYFIKIEDLEKTKNAYVISLERAEKIGLTFEKLISLS
jgi:Holliday junction resolvase